MAKIADYSVTGASKRIYTFEVYPYNSQWNEVAAVYVVTKRTPKTGGGGSHTNIYVGQTDNLKERHSGHHKEDCFKSEGANCLSVLREDSEEKRLDIESDILEGGYWPCND